MLTPESVKLGRYVQVFFPYGGTVRRRERYIGEDGRGHYRFIEVPVTGGYYRGCQVLDVDEHCIKVEIGKWNHETLKWDFTQEWISMARVDTRYL